MQELVKVKESKTIITVVAILHGIKLSPYIGGILKYNFLINPFSSDAYICPTIHYNAGRNYKINTHYNAGADEFVAWK